jgi:ribosomal protein L34E
VSTATDTGLVRVVPALLRRYDRELTCSQCRSVIAWIEIRPFALLHIQDTNRHEVTPFGGALAMHIATTRLERAESAAVQEGREPSNDHDTRAAQDLIAYLHRQAGEVIYELTCATCGARYVRSLPHLAKDVRKSPWGRVQLR